MTEHVAVETVVNILKDEIRIANQSQKVALQRVLHEVRYVAHRTAHFRARSKNGFAGMWKVFQLRI